MPRPDDATLLRRGLPPAVAWLVGQQRGLVSREQALAAGLTDKAIAWRVATGRWRTVHPGVHDMSPGRDDPAIRGLAALLLVGVGTTVRGAALVGPSAAHLWGLVAHAPPVVHVGIPESRRVTVPDGILVRRMTHFEGALDPQAFPWRTTAPVTILDAAATGGADAAVSLVARAIDRGLTSESLLRRELGRRRGHVHGRLLREVLEPVVEGAASPAEVRYVRDVERAHGLPRGVRQQSGRTGPLRLHDTVHEEFGVVVEVDGRLGHQGWAGRVRDGRRDRAAARDGNLTLRVFWPDVAVTPCETAVEVGAVLRRRGWSGRPRPCRRPGCAAGRQSPNGGTPPRGRR